MTKVIYSPYSSASPMQWPRGIECTLEYNGLIFNSRRRTEGIFVDTITGLDDPDIRDNRFPNPDRDGETVFDALYGGRTITLTGRVVAGNVTYMRYLWSNVKAAFTSLTEHPLIFRYNDVKNDFSNPNWGIDYAFNSTTQFSTTNNRLVFLTTGTKIANLLPAIQTVVDSEVSYTVNTGSAGTLGTYRAFLKYIDTNNYLAVQFTPANGLLRIVVNVAGVVTTLTSSSAITPVSNTEYTLRGNIQGNDVIAELFLGAADDRASTAIATTSTTLTSTNATQFGSGVPGQTGWFVAAGAGDGTTYIDNFESKVLGPGDYHINCQKATKLESNDAQSNNKVQRDFMITLRASDPRMVSRKLHKLATTITSAGLTFPGGGGGFTFPATAPFGLVFGQSMASITNLGNSKSYPIIRITGQATNPAVYNSTNGTVTSVAGSIATGDYLEFDVFNRTVVDSLGTNKYSLLGSNNTWLSLESGANALSFGADAFSGTVVTVWYRHSSL